MSNLQSKNALHQYSMALRYSYSVDENRLNIAWNRTLDTLGFLHIIKPSSLISNWQSSQLMLTTVQFPWSTSHIIMADNNTFHSEVSQIVQKHKNVIMYNLFCNDD